MDAIALADRPSRAVATEPRSPNQSGMDPVTIVEVQDQKGLITARQKVTQSVFSVGRGPDNDVVVDDEYVDPVHLRVSVDQDSPTVLVQDVGTENGTKFSGGLLQDAEAILPLGESVTIGRTTLVFTSPDRLVAAAKSLGPPSSRFLTYERLPAWKPVFFASFLYAAHTYLTAYTPKNAAAFLGAGVGTATALVLWAALWALGGRLFAGAARFRQHLAFASLASLITLPISVGLGWLAYALGSPVFTAVYEWGVMGLALWGLVLLGHVDIASAKSKAFKLSIAGAITASLVGLAAAGSELALSPAEEIANALQRVYPAPAGLTRSQSLEAFLESASDLER